jgi:uncharacterized membrane protein
VVHTADGVATGAHELLRAYSPALQRAAPLVDRFVEGLSATEVDTILDLIDRLPSEVGPDVKEIIEVLKDVRIAVQGLPGFRLLRRRGEREEAEHEHRGQ